MDASFEEIAAQEYTKLGTLVTQAMAEKEEMHSANA